MLLQLPAAGSAGAMLPALRPYDGKGLGVPEATPPIWRSFIRDWIIFAPLAVWVALVMSVFLHRNLVEGEIVNGALLTYAIAVAAAHISEIENPYWTASNRRVYRLLGNALPNLNYVITIIAFISLSVGYVHKALPKVPQIGLSDAYTCALGAVLASTGLLMSIFVLIARNQTGAKEK